MHKEVGVAMMVIPNGNLILQQRLSDSGSDPANLVGLGSLAGCKYLDWAGFLEWGRGRAPVVADRLRVFELF